MPETGQEPQNTGVVSGAVTCRERMILHPRSELRVQVLDISRAGAPARLLGEQVYQTGGKQVPLAFAIAYDEASIDPRFTYSVSARILDPAGQLVFVSDTVTPVITRGNPTSDVVVNLLRVKR